MKLPTRSTSSTSCLRNKVEQMPTVLDTTLHTPPKRPRKFRPMSMPRISFSGFFVALFFVLMPNAALGQESGASYCDDGTCVLDESDLRSRLEAAFAEGRAEGIRKGYENGYEAGHKAGIEEGRRRERTIAAIAAAFGSTGTSTEFYDVPKFYQAALVQFSMSGFLEAAGDSSADQGDQLPSEVYEYRRPEQDFWTVEFPDQFDLKKKFDVWKVAPGATAFDRFRWKDYWQFDLEKGTVEWIPYRGTTPAGVTIEEPVVTDLSVSKWWNSVNMEADLGSAIVGIAGKGNFPHTFSIVPTPIP